MLLSNSPESLLLESPNDPPIVVCDLSKGQGLDSMKVKPLPLSIIKDEPDAVNEDYLSYCCIFVTLMLFMPPMSGIERKLDMEVEFDFWEGGPSDRARPNIVVQMDRIIWKFFILKKNLNPESLRWFLLLQEFEFEVFEKG